MNKHITINKGPDRTAYQHVSPDDIECLISWPKGSAGEREERLLLHTLISLANAHGYGRLSQLAAQLEDLWRHPENVTLYEKSKKDALALMNRGQ